MCGSPDVAAINCLGREVTVRPLRICWDALPRRRYSGHARDIIDCAEGSREFTAS